VSRGGPRRCRPRTVEPRREELPEAGWRGGIDGDRPFLDRPEASQAASVRTPAAVTAARTDLGGRDQRGWSLRRDRR
jgi:hypothetical protein